MNQLCECPLAGFCARHKVEKSAREHQLCRGINCTGSQSAKYWNAWENGLLANQGGEAPVVAPVDFAKGHQTLIPNPSRGFGDWVSSAITAVTGIQSCGGCKQRAAWLNHFFPATLPKIEPVTFTAPVRHLTFHIYPVSDHGAWQWNCDQLSRHALQFNGRRIVSIVTDKHTDAAEAVQDYLRDFTDEFIVAKNNPQLREVATWLPMLERLEHYQSDQDVTFACQAKGVRRPMTAHQTDGVFPWTSAMYELCLSRPAEVLALLATHATAGAFRRYGAPQNGWGPWHYSGTFFWWRNRDGFRRNWRYTPQSFFGTAAWPGLMFSPEESACILGDGVNDLYNRPYWDRHIEPQLREWRERQ